VVGIVSERDENGEEEIKKDEVVVKRIRSIRRKKIQRK
jgi:hypothetical protein